MKNFTPIKFIFLLFSTTLFAQNEANFWYFSDGKGLDFSTTPPTILNNGQTPNLPWYQMEAYSTVSDSNGDLLFYATANTLWDKEHNVFPNGMGLLGNNSTSQGVISIPKPNNPDIYYVFTNTSFSTTVGNLYYSIVDVGLEGNGTSIEPLGDVTDIKNELLYLNSTEKLTAISNQSKDSIWVVTHGYGNDLDLDSSLPDDTYGQNYYAWLITEKGIEGIETSAIGFPVVSNIGLEINCQGNSFNGVIGQLKISPIGDKIAAAHGGCGTVELLDFDFSTGSISNPVVLATDDTNKYGISFSPNGSKLYLTSRFPTDATNPNSDLIQYDLTAGTNGCQYATNQDIVNSVTILSSGPNNQAFQQLQLGIDGNLYIQFYDSENIGAITNPNEEAALINFDPNFIEYSSVVNGLGLPNFIESYFVDETNSGDLFVELGENQEICAGGEPLILDAFVDSDAAYLWQDGSTNSTFSVSSEGVYFVNVTLGNCSASDTIVISTLAPQVNEVFVEICEGDSHFASGDSQFESGIYIDTISTANCDSILITNLTVIPLVENEVFVEICEGDTHFAGGESQSESGVYTDTISTSSCDSVLITNLTVIPLVENEVLVEICEGDSYFAGGVLQSESGVYIDTILTENCDNILITNLTVVPSIEIDIEIINCEENTTGVYEVLFGFSGGLPSINDNNQYSVTGSFTGITSLNEVITANANEGSVFSLFVTDGLCSAEYSMTLENCTKTNVEWLHFDGLVTRNGNELFWSTATEINSSFFNIQFSSDGYNFKNIGKVEAKGNTNTQIDYKFVDNENLKFYPCFYRIEENDINGFKKYSNSIALTKNENLQTSSIFVYPSPARESISLQIPVTTEKLLDVVILNSNGQIVLRKKQNLQYNSNLDISQLPSGLYFVKASKSNGGNYYGQFVKK